MLPKADREEVYELRATLGRIVGHVVIAWPRLTPAERVRVLRAFRDALETVIGTNVVPIGTARRPRRKAVS